MRVGDEDTAAPNPVRRAQRVCLPQVTVAKA